MVTEQIDAEVSQSGLESTRPERGIALCLSGGGYRAMLFHVGALVRLNEVGLLAQLQRVSSVSGGSITAAQLGLRWRKLQFDGGVAQKLVEHVVDPIRFLASKTIDVGAVIGGVLSPCSSIGDKVANAYREHLFGNATLQDLPDDTEGPRFVINATNVQTCVLWRFSRPYMGDYKVGRVMSPKLKLATAVAASSAFPPVLSPMRLRLSATDFVSDSATELNSNQYRTDVVLTDGGVYDNLGLETAWKRYETLLVSDGGQQVATDPNPKRDWARHAIRINSIIDNQVRSLRKRQLINAFKAATEHNGTYWSIRSRMQDYSSPPPLDCPTARTQELATTPTRLRALPTPHQERLINWGYAICAAAIDSHYHAPIRCTATFPYSRGI